eukprot:g1704.t1
MVHAAGSVDPRNNAAHALTAVLNGINQADLGPDPEDQASRFTNEPNPYSSEYKTRPTMLVVPDAIPVELMGTSETPTLITVGMWPVWTACGYKRAQGGPLTHEADSAALIALEAFARADQQQFGGGATQTPARSFFAGGEEGLIPSEEDLGHSRTLEDRRRAKAPNRTNRTNSARDFYPDKVNERRTTKPSTLLHCSAFGKLCEEGCNTFAPGKTRRAAVELASREVLSRASLRSMTHCERHAEACAVVVASQARTARVGWRPSPVLATFRAESFPPATAEQRPSTVLQQPPAGVRPNTMLLQPAAGPAPRQWVSYAVDDSASASAGGTAVIMDDTIKKRADSIAVLKKDAAPLNAEEEQQRRLQPRPALRIDWGKTMARHTQDMAKAYAEDEEFFWLQPSLL